MKSSAPLLAIPLILSLTACGGGAQSDTQNPVQGPDTSTDKVVGKDLRMSLNLSALESAGVNADRVIVTVSSGDFSRTVEVPQTDYSATAEFSSLVVGEYSVSVRVMDGETEVATGSGTAHITLNTVSVVDLVLELNSGGLVVNVCGVPPEPSENTFVATTHYRVATGPDRRVDNSGVDGVSVHLRSDLAYANLAADTEITAHLQLNREWEDPDAVPLVSVSPENSIKLSTADGTFVDFSGCFTRIEHVSSLPLGVITGAPLYIRADIDVDGTEMLVDKDGNILLDTDGSPNTRQVKKIRVSYDDYDELDQSKLLKLATQRYPITLEQMFGPTAENRITIEAVVATGDDLTGTVQAGDTEVVINSLRLWSAERIYPQP